ncbi:hypothetical protein EZS27_007187 [termite gut metagenome]|uniref:Cyclic GMP-AMP synthase DncV-like nucleotidyltransferase domain-containing protein n=1 Tax=termite gut metagenome TaxID=433724 RepID=A0A5J4SIQ9_9ZZZZ
MANNHSQFIAFNQSIKLSDENRQILMTARESLRKRIKEAFNKLSEQDRQTHTIEFQSQGSFVMDTIIKPLKDDFDLDDGVYFQGNLPEEKRAKPQVFHSIVIKAIDKHYEIEDISDKPTCVRVKYDNNYSKNNLGFHIDLPIYYAEKFETPELAHTKDGWVESNPVEFISWFEEKAQSGFQKVFLYESLQYAEPFQKWLSDIRKKDCQLRRIVRYLKAWADLKRKEMPCGIIMSILAANNYVANERDDISLRDTLINIKTELEVNGCKCFRPTPKAGEDLFATKTQEEKQYFLNALNEFVTSANQSIENTNPKESCLKWQKHFGDRFSCSTAKDEDEQSIAKTYSAPAVIASNAKSA